MWQNVDEADGDRRQEELKTSAKFWGGMIQKGSRVLRHDDTHISAMNIVSYILDQRKMTVLQVQRQMVDEGLALNETSAGQELEKELTKQRELFERRLREAREEMKEAMAEGSRVSIEEANAQHDRFQSKLDETMKESEEIKLSMQHLVEQKDAEHQQAIAQLELARHQSEDVSAQLMSMRRQASLHGDDSDEQHHRHLLKLEELNLQSQISFQEWRMKQLPSPKDSHGTLAEVGTAFATGTASAVGGAAVNATVTALSNNGCTII